MYLFIILLFTFFIFCVLKVRTSRLHRTLMKLPPGVPELPILGAFLHLLGNSEDIMRSIKLATINTMKLGGASRLIALHKYYYIGLTDASDIAEALSLCVDKDYIYSFLQAVTGNGSVFAPTPIAKVRRRVIMPSFTPKVLNDFVDIIWEESIKLGDMLALHSGTGPFCIEEYLQNYNFNVLIKASGVKYSEYSGSQISNSFNEGCNFALKRIARPWLHPNFLHKLSSNYSETQRYVKIMNYSAHKVIDKRRNDLKNVKPSLESDSNKIQKGIFDALLYSQLSNEEIREEVAVFLGANDLSSVSVGFTLLLLGLYPSVQDKLYKELEFAFEGSNKPSVKDVMKISYLDRVVKESLRLFPPAPVIVRQANKEAKLSSGRIIPAGAGVFSFIYGLHRNPKHWGPDADHFDPDRFLPERFENVHPKAFIPFSYGARKCMGYEFGLMTMKAALSTIIRKYKIVGEAAQGPVPNIRTKYEIFMKPLNNFQIEIVNRI